MDQDGVKSSRFLLRFSSSRWHCWHANDTPGPSLLLWKNIWKHPVEGMRSYVAQASSARCNTRFRSPYPKHLWSPGGTFHCRVLKGPRWSRGKVCGPARECPLQPSLGTWLEFQSPEPAGAAPAMQTFPGDVRTGSPRKDWPDVLRFQLDCPDKTSVPSPLFRTVLPAVHGFLLFTFQLLIHASHFVLWC